mmetsp:Transcript_10548/g.43950  ORF Transcript_10548/g.43950 Transcript_10548/m.43950 type:complete len:103 (-) Transcript_10548:2837-3145(-)
MLARVLRYQRWSKSFANGKAIEARVRSRFAGSLVKDSDAEELAEAQRQKWEREFLKASGGAEDPANGEFKVLLNAVRDHQVGHNLRFPTMSFSSNRGRCCVD